MLSNIIEFITWTIYCLLFEDINSEGFQKLLSFVYTGDLELSEHNVKVVMRAAQKMQVPEAVGLCRQFVADGHRQTETHTADASEQVNIM